MLGRYPTSLCVSKWAVRPQRPSSWPWRALRDRAGRQHPAVTSDMAKSLSGPPLPAPPPWEEAEPQSVCCPARCLSCPGAQSGGEEPHVERDCTCCVEPTLPCHSLGPPEVGEGVQAPARHRHMGPWGCKGWGIAWTCTESHGSPGQEGQHLHRAAYQCKLSRAYIQGSANTDSIGIPQTFPDCTGPPQTKHRHVKGQTGA